MGTQLNMPTFYYLTEIRVMNQTTWQPYMACRICMYSACIIIVLNFAASLTPKCFALLQKEQLCTWCWCRQLWCTCWLAKQSTLHWFRHNGAVVMALPNDAEMAHIHAGHSWVKSGCMQAPSWTHIKHCSICFLPSRLLQVIVGQRVYPYCSKFALLCCGCW